MKKIILIVLLVVFLNTPVFSVGFIDVPDSAWFFNDVMSLQEKGIISGYVDGTFKPSYSITNAEALKLILGVASIEARESGIGSHWASGLVQVAKERGIVDLTTNDINNKASREAVADMLVRALKLENQIVDIDYFKDTQSKNVHILNSIGVIKGVVNSDGVYFNPDSEITRAEIGSIVLRAYNYKLQEIVEETNLLDKRLKLHQVITKEEIEIPANPKDVEDLVKVFLYMGSQNVHSYTINYPNISYDTIISEKYVEKLSEAFEAVFARYPEYFSFTNRVEYKYYGSMVSSKVIITLSNDDFNNDKVIDMKNTFFTEVKNTVSNLIAEEKITSEMTQKEMAKVLYKWIAVNTKYDTRLTPEGFTGYGQIVNGKASCQGYTATYNLMCKLLGIEVFGITGKAGTGAKKENHIWTIANLDGEIVHIDTTFGDPVPNKDGYVDFSYFARNSSFMKKTHNWIKLEFEN